jgi:hypothetical protein
MARDKVSRHLSKFWWVLAFTLGSAGGALSSEFLHAQNTFWIILFLGAVSGAVAIFEQFGESRGRRSRATSGNTPRRGGRSLPNHPLPPHKQANGKRPARRAQLHAITGKKNAEPPSSGTS